MSVALNKTMNGTQPSSCYNTLEEKIRQTVVYCLVFLVSLVGNTIIGIIVYKTKPMRKPINFLILNIAMSDLLYPIIIFPFKVQRLYIDSWLIGGPLGQALYKFVFFLTDVSLGVSVQSLVLIAVGRSGAVVLMISPSFPTQSCAHSSFSSLGSSRWLTSPHVSSATNLLNITEDLFVVAIGKKPLESPRPLRAVLVTFCRTRFDPACCDGHTCTLHHNLFLSSSHKRVQASNQPTLDNNVSKGNEMC